ELDASARGRLLDALRNDPDPPFFVMGSLVASARVRGDGAIIFALFTSDFPKNSRPLLVLEDLVGSDAAAFGSLGTAYLGGSTGLHPYSTGAAGAETLALLSRTLAALRDSAIAAFELREATRSSIDSRAASRRLAAQRRAFERMV